MSPSASQQAVVLMVGSAVLSSSRAVGPLVWTTGPGPELACRLAKSGALATTPFRTSSRSSGQERRRRVRLRRRVRSDETRSVQVSGSGQEPDTMLRSRVAAVLWARM